jgi:uncharacterized protein (TIGR02145 family)
LILFFSYGCNFDLEFFYTSHLLETIKINSLKPKAMRKKENAKLVIAEIALFVSAALLMALTLNSCQKGEEILNPLELGLKSDPASEITLGYPVNDVTAGEDFSISFSSTCGRIMIERGFIEEIDPITNDITKVYSGLGCETENLFWEEVDGAGFAGCQGGTITENLTEAGTYVYRAKLNFKAKAKSGCADCGTFSGNKYECFTVAVVAGGGNENEGTFTDARDGKVYKWVKIGNQVWMAENLVYNGPGSDGNAIDGIYAYENNANNVAFYGRLYKYNAAIAACPAGWHLPTNDEWNILINYLTANGYGFEGSGDDVAKALAAKSGWEDSPWPGFPGNDQGSNNSSGFSAVPGGERAGNGYFWDIGRYAEFWTATKSSEYLATIKALAYSYSGVYTMQGVWTETALSVRCVKNTD